MPLRPLLVAAFVLLLPCGYAQAQCWVPAPAHGTNGVPYPARGWTIWDPDGAGPLPPTLVISIDSGVLYWTGSQFVTIGGSPVGQIRCLCVYQGQLYAGGAFTKIGSDPVVNAARWDGAHWVQLGDGMTTQGDPLNPQGAVNAMVVFGGVLNLGGSMVPVDAGTWTSFAIWNGSALSVGTSTAAPISSFLVVSDQLYT